MPDQIRQFAVFASRQSAFIMDSAEKPGTLTGSNAVAGKRRVASRRDLAHLSHPTLGRSMSASWSNPRPLMFNLVNHRSRVLFAPHPPAVVEDVCGLKSEHQEDRNYGQPKQRASQSELKLHGQALQERPRAAKPDWRGALTKGHLRPVLAVSQRPATHSAVGIQWQRTASACACCRHGAEARARVIQTCRGQGLRLRQYVGPRSAPRSNIGPRSQMKAYLAR